MSKVFCCKDLGIECTWQAVSESEEALFEIVVEHAKNVHNMKEINEAIRIKILGSIRDRE